MSNIIVVYVAGPFRGPNAWEIEQNIRRAEELALEVWRLGCAAITPHCNTRFFHGSAPDEVWLEGDLEILRRCDAMILTKNWALSSGTCAEIQEAEQHGMPIFETIGQLKDYMADRESVAIPQADGYSQGEGRCAE